MHFQCKHSEVQAMIKAGNHADCESLVKHVTSQDTDVTFPPVIGTLNKSANLEVSLCDYYMISLVFGRLTLYHVNYFCLPAFRKV